MCIDDIAHHRAICSCPTSHSLPLALALSRGDTLYALRIPLISDATKGAHSLYSSCLSPERLSLPSLFPSYSLDILGRCVRILHLNRSGLRYYTTSNIICAVFLIRYTRGLMEDSEKKKDLTKTTEICKLKYN